MTPSSIDPVADPIVGGVIIDPRPTTTPGDVLVRNLDASLPLVLLPVRVATRFHRPRRGADPTELRVRIFPDALHADAHRPELTTDEITVGQSYWEKLWRAGGDPAGRAAAHDWVITLVGAPRAVWVARQTAPLNPASAPVSPVPADQPLDPPPTFPQLVPRAKGRPVQARLLPERWCVIVRRSIESVRHVWSAPVHTDLAVAPDLGDLSADGDVRELLASQDLSWMVDFEEAVEAGMAVRIPWNREPGVPAYVTELLVLGVRGDDSQAATELAELFDAHRLSAGLEFVAPGTPTNNTETVQAGWSEQPADPEAYFDRQLPDVTARRPPLLSAADFGTLRAADATSLLLGLADANALDRAEHAGLRTGLWARDMNRILWPATLAHLFTRLLTIDGTPPMGSAGLQWLRDWFGDWVRAGGFLPTIRVGDHPYGLLPVALRPQFDSELTDAPVDVLRDVLRNLGAWEVAIGNVPSFSAPDPALAGRPPITPEEEAVRLAAVLGAVPHPTAFRLRPASDQRADITAAWEDQITELERLLSVSPNVLSAFYFGGLFEDRMDIPIAQGTIHEQGLALSRLRDHAASLVGGTSGDAEVVAVIDHIDRMLRPLTAAHEVRSRTRSFEPFSEATLPTAGDPPLWYADYGSDQAGADGSFPTLRLLPAGDPTAVAGLLRGYADDARAAVGFPRPAYPAGQPAALLEKLVQQAVQTVAASDAGQLAEGLEGLADMLEDGGLADPLGELRRLTRETLGLATHRYDAWVTGHANATLAEVRRKRPTGLQIGAYGWLVNVVPDEGGGDTHGFVHAPSLDHAATAAVLRSAWLAHADSPEDTPFAVDLSSDRVRRALWLLEGVRNGVDLAELLGARFERRLHDHGLPHLIADVRERVLEATGVSGQPANAIVDGLALATAYSQSRAGDPVYDVVEAWRATLGEEGGQLHTHLLDTVADLDATSDVLTAQAVHAVLKGNLTEAASTLSVAGAGESGIPPVRLPSVRREARLVEHRIVAVFPLTTGPAAGPPSLLALAEPAMAAWLAVLLPDLDAVGVRAAVAGPDGGRPWDTTLGDLGLGPADVVLLAAPGGDPDGGRLGALLAARARFDTGAPGDAAVTVTDRPSDAVGLSDLAVVAGALRSLVGAARPLRAADLTTAAGDEGDDPAGTVDVAELDGRRRALATALDALGSQRPGPALLARRFAELAAVDPDLLVAALADPPDDVQHLAALLDKASEAARGLREPLPDGYAGWPPEAQARHLAERIRSALGVDLPVLPRCTPADAEAVRSSFAATTRRTGPPLRPLAWLLEVGRVHPGAGRCAEALDLVESINPTARLPVQAAQLPHLPGEPWVAVAAPTGDDARVHVLSVTDAAAAMGEGAVAGLLFEAWSEPIPGRGATTGLAVHFDKPGAQPPQAVLLATAPPEEGWTREGIELLLLQTLELAQMRAVGPETLPDLGQLLPAVFLPGDVAVEHEEPVS